MMENAAAMGHDEHFLSRLDRVNRTEMDFALSLYRDHELVRWVLNRARVPEEADRIAIAISDDKDPAHLIVARDGGFVTCLAAGMSIGDRPRVARRELDRLVEQSREFRERMAKMRNDSSLAWFLRRLWTAGARIAREDFLPYVQIAPIVDTVYARLFFDAVLRTHSSYPRILRELRKPYPDEDMLRAYWLDHQLARHTMLLSALSPHVIDQIVKRVIEQEQREDVPILATYWAVTRNCQLSSLSRLAWTVERIGAPLRDAMISFHGDQYTLSFQLVGSIACAVLNLDNDQAARRHAARRVQELDARPGTDWHEVVRLAVARRAANAHRDPAASRQEAFEAVRQMWVQLTNGACPPIPEDDPEGLVTAALGSIPLNPFKEGYDFAALSVGAVHLLRGARAEMLYPPRRWLDVFGRPYETEHLRQLMLIADAETPEKVPVRKREETPGRNEKCPCGSGRKWKRCCGG